jgi:hypothetical protein
VHILALLVSAFSALANWIPAEGTFVLDHEIAMRNYENRTVCEEEGGAWREGFCFFAAADQVVVKLSGGAHRVTVNTTTTNGHTCEFSAPARWTARGLLAKAESMEWDQEKDAYAPATCEVLVRYVDANQVNVSHNGRCRSFCGMRADLAIEGARRR